jgi:small subunit ribosomal protein S1
MLKSLTPVFGADKRANQLLTKYHYQVKTKDILAGTLVGFEKTQILVHVGLKKAAFLPSEEIAELRPNKGNQWMEKTKVGEFLVIDYHENKTVLSLRRLHFIRLWERFKQIDFKNMILYPLLEKRVVGARLLSFDGLRLYVPNHHLPKYYRRRQTKTEEIQVSILEVKDKKHSIVASTRLAILKKQSPSLKLGLVQDGIVLAVKPFGIFLNVFGIKCLLHVSEISNQKIKNLPALYQKGDGIKVKVLYVNGSQGKIALSAKL